MYCARCHRKLTAPIMHKGMPFGPVCASRFGYTKPHGRKRKASEPVKRDEGTVDMFAEGAA